MVAERVGAAEADAGRDRFHVVVAPAVPVPKSKAGDKLRDEVDFKINDLQQKMCNMEREMSGRFSKLISQKT